MIYFCKMQATGNDFIIINVMMQKFRYSYGNLAKFLCNRKYGVGADGVIFIEKSEVAEYKMRIFNSDGTEAGMCGNGIRCLAKYLYEESMVSSSCFKIETISGIKELELSIENKTVSYIKVCMGNPIFEYNKIPVIFPNILEKSLQSLEIDIEDKKYNYQKEYKKFLKDIVHNYGNMFPASMEREYLKSSRLKDNNLLDSDSVLNIMNNSESSTDINSTVNFNDLPLYYINFGSLYKNYKNSIGEVVIERAALNDESKAITDSCTLIGDFPNDTMYINPGDKDIWIRLINFHGQSGFKIIVDDSGTGKVNFFVPGAGEFINYFRTNKDIITVNIQNFEWWSDYVYSDGNVKLEDTWILTKTYADCFKDGKFEIMKNPNLFNEGEQKMIPNINVMSPTAYLNQSGTPPLLDIKYNSNNYMPINTGFIGSVIFKEIDAQNDTGFVYVNPEPKSDSVPESEKPVKFTVLYYQCY